MLAGTFLKFCNVTQQVIYVCMTWWVIQNIRKVGIYVYVLCKLCGPLRLSSILPTVTSDSELAGFRRRGTHVFDFILSVVVFRTHSKSK